MPSSISCTTETYCVIGGVDFLASTKDAGKTWAQSPTGIFGVYALDCAELVGCYATGAEAVLAMNPNGTWSQDYTIPVDGFLQAIDCVDRMCVVVGSSDDSIPLVYIAR
jgi:hypothetical protein